MHLVLRGSAFVFLIFVFFPYLKLIPSSSYQQPYALIFGIMTMFLASFNKVSIQKKLFFNAMNFGLIGLIGFIITCFPYNNFQDYKVLMSYLTVPVVGFASYISIKIFGDKLLKILKYFLFIWLLTGLIQQFYSPSFLTVISSESAHSIVNTGRGVLSLAPEATHYGFHMLLIAYVFFLFKHPKLTLIALFQTFFLARSSSALLACILSLLVFYVFSKWTLKKFIFVCSSVLLLIIGIIYLMSLDFNNPLFDIRILRLLKIGITDLNWLLTEGSFNLRIGGLFTTFEGVYQNALMPHGLSQNSWIDHGNIALQEYNWLTDFSKVQPPSGIGAVLFQIGFFALPFFGFVYLRLRSIPNYNYFFDWYKYVLVFIFLFQLTFSTPLFSFIIALMIYYESEK